MIIDVDEALRKLREPKLKFDVYEHVQIVKNADRDGYRNLLGCVGEVVRWTKYHPSCSPPDTYYYQYRVKIQGHTNKYNDTVYYFASYEKGLKVNDLVCVHTRFGFNIATVVAIDVDAKEVQCCVTEQVVSKINVTAYNKRIEQAERIQELEKVLDQKLKEAQKLAIFEMFSKNDEEFAKLLSEYKSLTENK